MDDKLANANKYGLRAIEISWIERSWSQNWKGPDGYFPGMVYFDQRQIKLFSLNHFSAWWKLEMQYSTTAARLGQKQGLLRNPNWGCRAHGALGTGDHNALCTGCPLPGHLWCSIYVAKLRSWANRISCGASPGLAFTSSGQIFVSLVKFDLISSFSHFSSFCTSDKTSDWGKIQTWGVCSSR